MKPVSVSIVSVDDILEDSQNPNSMTDKEIKALVVSIKKFGFIVPVITNKDLLIADGHQRLKAARLAGLEQIPVVKLDVKEVDRLMIQQVMNKLKGDHDGSRDKEIFEYILSQEGDLKQIAALLAVEESSLLKLTSEAMEQEQSIDLTTEYQVVIECTNETEQERIYQDCVLRGLKCRVLTL